MATVLAWAVGPVPELCALTAHALHGTVSLSAPWNYGIFVCCFFGPSFRTWSTSWLRKQKFFVFISRGGFSKLSLFVSGAFFLFFGFFFVNVSFVF